MRHAPLTTRLILLALLVGLAAPAWGFPANRHKRDMRAEVEAADVAWRDAELSNDAAAIDRILSEDYLGITGTGQVVTKAQQLERVRSRQMQISHLQITDVKIKLLGRTAVLTSRAELDGSIDGHPYTGMFRSTRVYQRTPAGVWKLTSFEATRIRDNHTDDQASNGQ
jgi:ketosteroid isomerase-like protein